MQINNDQIVSLTVNAESEFSVGGCENCGDKLGCDVFMCAANTKSGDMDFYVIALCIHCRNAYFNADPLPEGCRDLYKIMGE